MSAQNNLKKPAFTKTMLGYTPKEVDQYIDYVIERYAAVSRDVLELKRRVARLQLGLDPIDSAPKEPAAKPGLSDDAMERLRAMIESEKRRHEEAMSALLGFVEAQSRGEAAPKKKSAAEPAVFEDSKSINDVGSIEAVEDPEDPESGFVPLPDDGDGEILSDKDSDWAEALGKLVDGAEIADDSGKSADDGEKNSDDGKDYADAVVSEENPSESKKTPAELAEALDFYSDPVVRDGESFDPMSLAQSSAAMRRRPTLQDFMRPIDSEDRPKK